MKGGKKKKTKQTNQTKCNNSLTLHLVPKCQPPKSVQKETLVHGWPSTPMQILHTTTCTIHTCPSKQTHDGG